MQNQNEGSFIGSPEQATMAAWNAVAEETAGQVDTAKVDALVSAWAAARADYDAKKKISNDAHEVCEELKAKVLSTLKFIKKTKYHVDGVGTVSIKRTFQISMPKGLTEKQKLIDYFTGKSLAPQYLTVNHQTLNSYFNVEREKDPAFKLPGVADPVADESVALRK